MPLHTGKGRTVAAALERTTNYVENPDKTNSGEFISAYECNPSIADQEFLFSKRQYETSTGRNQGDSDVIAYHLRQSFKPGEIDPERANKIGYDLAMSLTKGKHAFIVCTHIDKTHVHSHIIFNSTSLDCTRKFRNFWGSSFAIRRLSDILCAENGLSIIENPKPSRGSYGAWLGDGKALSARGQLERIIDGILAGECKDFDSFLAAMRAANVEVKQGKHLAFRIPNGKRFIRCDSLSEEYSEKAIRARVAGKRVVKAKEKAEPAAPQMLIDIQARMQQANSPAFRRWATKENLREMAKTMTYLKEKGLMDYAVLSKTCAEASARVSSLSKQSKANSERMKQISELQKQIGVYAKTREVYLQYRKLPQNKQTKFYNEHTGEIIACQAAKRYFDSIGLKKFPPMQSLKREYAALSAENKKVYSEYKQARKEMTELMTVKHNVERILGMKPEKTEPRRQQEQER